MNRRVLAPLAALVLLGAGLGWLWLSLEERVPGPHAAEAPGENLAREPAPGPLEPLSPPADDPPPDPGLDPDGSGAGQRVSLGEIALPVDSPERPEPGEYDGPSVRVDFDDGTPCFEAQQSLDANGNWVLDGRWTSWHENGQVQEQGWYENHRETGGWQWWDENGQRIAVGTFFAGQREGTWTFWYSNGVRQVDAQYADGKGSGFWTLYFDDGQKCAEGQFLDGELDGHWTVWDEFGAVNPERSGMYRNGQLISD